MPVPTDEVGLTAMLIKWIWVPIVTLVIKVFWDETRFKELKKEREAIVSRQNKRITELEKDTASLKTTCVTENNVRTILKETMEPFFIDQKETRDDIKTISENLTKLRVDVAGENASRRD